MAWAVQVKEAAIGHLKWLGKKTGRKLLQDALKFLEQDRSDQESRQHEEQIHADPAAVDHALDQLLSATGVLKVPGRVVDDDGEDGDATHAVKSRYVAPDGWSCAGALKAARERLGTRRHFGFKLGDQAWPCAMLSSRTRAFANAVRSAFRRVG